MAQERDIYLNKELKALPHRKLAVCFNNGKSRCDLSKTHVGPGTNDDLNDFMGIAVRDAQSEIDSLRYIGDKPHGPRPSREITDIMKHRWPAIKTLEHQVSVLKGETAGPIEVSINSEGYISGISVGSFSESERLKWEEILKKP